jgi:hypothetical protein
MKHIAPGGEHRLNLARWSLVEHDGSESPVPVSQFLDALRPYWDTGLLPSVTIVTKGEKANMASA